VIMIAIQLTTIMGASFCSFIAMLTPSMYDFFVEFMI